MKLLVNGSTFRIAQMGSDFLILDKPLDYPPCEATIVFSVDDSERQWRVQLPEGISLGGERIPVARV